MIERLQLRRWRAFDHVDLALEPGTTFIVAPNGVGKTSLLLGIAWAIFGEHSTVNAHQCVRAGASSAEAEVSLRLPDHRQLNILRTTKTTGRPTAVYTLDGAPLGGDAANALLQAAYEIQLPVAAQLSMMLGGGHVATQDALDLHNHLYEAFGMVDLLTAAEYAAKAAKAAIKQRESVRSAARQRLVDRTSSEAELRALEEGLEELRRQRAPLQSALAHSDRLRELSTAWSHYARAAADREAALVDLVTSAAAVLDEPPDADRLLTQLDSTAAHVSADLAMATDQLTTARAQALTASNALVLLGGDEPACPTCLRPFHDQELGQAVRTHHDALYEARENEQRWTATVNEQQQSLARIEKLCQGVLQLASEAARPAEPRPDQDVDALHEAALAALQEHDTRVGRLEGQRDELIRTLTVDDDVRRAEDEQRSAYRREALTKAAAEAFQQAADELTGSYIEPLSEQVRWRWKALFGEGGLQLRPDGSIVRVVEDRELPWETLSGGERIWARLVTHLLVLSTSTRLPFAWFDEPLEHLDPRARRAVAGALATATRGSGLTQLIVTTYEHAIARQLAADTPEASIRYVRHGADPSDRTVRK